MEAFSFRLADGDRNAGTVYLPEERAARVPVLIVCHSRTSDRQLNPFTVELCTRLTTTGAAVVTFDFYGIGETGGDPRNWSYGRLTTNLTDVCRYVSSQAWADGTRIGALGVSAASTAVLRCAIDTRILAAGISVATFLGHYVLMPNGPAKLLVDHLDTLVDGETVDWVNNGTVAHRVRLDLLKDAVGGAPIYRLHTIACPILFLQGGADNVFRRSDARLGHELLRSHDLPASYVEIEAGDHILGNVPHEATHAVMAWLREIGFLPEAPAKAAGA